MKLFEKKYLPEDRFDKTELNFTDTISMMAEIEKRVSDDKSEIHQLLLSQVLKLTKIVQKDQELIAKLQDEIATHHMALFALTDKNDLGRRGLWHQMDGMHRFARMIVVALAATAGFIGWLLKYVLPIIIGSGVFKP